VDTLTRPLRLDSRPLYDQAIEALQQFIEDGRHQPGDRLPSEGELARQLGISRSTLREAMSFLESHGLVTRRHGAGTFVAQPSLPPLHSGLEQLESLHSLAQREGVRVQRRAWRVAVLPAPADIAAALALETGADVVSAQLTVAALGAPLARLHSYISAQHVDVEALRVYEGGSLLDFLNEQDDLRISSSRSEVYSVAAPAEVAKHLGVPLGAPLLHLQELQFNGGGRPLVLSRNYFRTDSYKFHIVRRAPRR
jgi:GntR family transcriptional regulator